MTRAITAVVQARDGDLCFYCFGRVGPEFSAASWLVNRGPTTAANAVLSHARCAQQFAGLSAAEKVKIHVQKAIALALAGAEEQRAIMAVPVTYDGPQPPR